MLTNEDYAKAFHEIKNSITIVSSSIQLLEKQHPELADYEYWTESRETLDYLKQMVQELSQANLATDFTLQPTNLNSLLNNILTSIRSLHYSNGCQCQDTIEENLPLIAADSMRLNQAIMNLIKNAFESMNMQGTILLNTYQKNQSIHIEIIDFGGGISSELTETLFSPFVTSKTNGTGLGLSISRQIIENHHGTLDYVSRPGDGCTFTITLPILDS